jgi:hypothetical protein
MLRAALASGSSVPSGSLGSLALLQRRLQRRSGMPSSASGLSREDSEGLDSDLNSPPCAPGHATLPTFLDVNPCHRENFRIIHPKNGSNCRPRLSVHALN